MGQNGTEKPDKQNACINMQIWCEIVPEVITVPSNEKYYLLQNVLSSTNVVNMVKINSSPRRSYQYRLEVFTLCQLLVFRHSNESIGKSLLRKMHYITYLFNLKLFLLWNICNWISMLQQQMDGRKDTHTHTHTHSHKESDLLRTQTYISYRSFTLHYELPW